MVFRRSCEFNIVPSCVAFGFLFSSVAAAGTNGTSAPDVEVIEENAWTEYIRPGLAQLLLFILFLFCVSNT